MCASVFCFPSVKIEIQSLHREPRHAPRLKNPPDRGKSHFWVTEAMCVEWGDFLFEWSAGEGSKINTISNCFADPIVFIVDFPGKLQCYS